MSVISQYLAGQMTYLLEGILLGLGLSIMIGPIFLALTQTSMERGAKAGITVAAGIWLSDFLIIGACYYFIRQISGLEYNPQFKLWMGICGGAVLIAFGLSALLKKIEINDTPITFRARTWLGFFAKGFLVNTINPFTFFFWISLIGTNVLARGLSHNDKMLLLSGIMATIIVVNSATAIGAKAIRTHLKERHLQWFSWVAGGGLLLFGIVLMIRVLY